MTTAAARSSVRAYSALLLQLRAWKPVDSVGGTNAAATEQLLAAAPRMRLLECDAPPSPG